MSETKKRFLYAAAIIVVSIAAVDRLILEGSIVTLVAVAAVFGPVAVASLNRTD